MKGFFSYDSGFFRALDKLGSLFILNMLTLVCSIPFFTIGASFTALHYVTMKMVRDEETYVTKDFFKSFKQNFRQGTVIWLILFVIGSVLIFDYRLMAANSENFAGAHAFMILTMACAVFYLVELAYVFPVLAKFYNTVRQTMKNAILMGIRHFPKTAAILVIDVIFLVITLIALYRNGRSFLAPLYVCLGFAVPAYANSYIFVKIFDQYIPLDENAETGSDEEYIRKLQEDTEDAAMTEETLEHGEEKEN
ncbi:MAG: YesL family protein [Lachnospiraceae bacterium]|nr:YesL family protein [Lachnospiraceae bacterium]